jgi:hypothetical protein
MHPSSVGGKGKQEEEGSIISHQIKLFLFFAYTSG